MNATESLFPLAPDDPRHGTMNGYSNRKCRCDSCRAAAAERGRRKRKRGLPPGDERHGTANGYNNYGCHCEACTAAWAIAFTAQSHRVGRCKPWADEMARRSAQREAMPHGTEAKYRYGCRCEECRASATAARRRRRQAKEAA